MARAARLNLSNIPYAALRKRAEAFERERLAVEQARANLQIRSPHELAALVDPTTVQTKALALLDDVIKRVDSGELQRVIISLPPQEGKSTRVTRFGIEWMLRNNPNRRFAIVSYSDDTARAPSYAIRNDIATNDGTEGTLDLGLRLRRDTRAASRWSLAYPNIGGIVSVPIGGGLTGKPVDGLVIDDPTKDYRDADSQIMTERAYEWWQSVGRPRLAPGAPAMLVLTRWSENDLAGKLMAKQAEDEASNLDPAHYDRWTVVNIPAEADHRPEKGEVDPLGREVGEFMESARGRTFDQWMATKTATDARIWSALFQGKPTPDTGDVFLRVWFNVNRYSERLWINEIDGSYRVQGMESVTQSWDMSFKDKKTSDWVVGQVWAKRGANVFLLDQVRARLNFPSTVDAVRRLKELWPQTGAVLIEAKANGQAVIDSLEAEIPGIIDISPTESKYSRSVAVTPFVRAGNVHVPHVLVDGEPLALFRVDEYVEEMVTFPNAANDDQVDTTTQYLKYALLDFHGVSIAVPQGRLPKTALPGAEPERPIVPISPAALNRRGARIPSMTGGARRR